VTNKKLIEDAQKLVFPKELSVGCISGEVGSIIVSDTGNVYTGISIDAPCGVGFCAEHSAIAEMLKNKESRIKTIVAAGGDVVYPPCGRCREFMYQVNPANLDTDIILDEKRTVKLKELLPEIWQDNIKP